MRDAGAKEIHFRVSSPPITHSDFYGIDTPSRDQLLASEKNVAEMCEYLGADSLSFLSIEGIYRALGHKDGRNADCPQYTDHCFTGDYPTNLEDEAGGELNSQLSFLSISEPQDQ